MFELMKEEGLFLRLVELVKEKREEDRTMWEVALELLYEMSRMQRLKIEDLEAVDDNVIKYLFELVEQDPDDPENDPYHYGVIRILVGKMLVSAGNNANRCAVGAE